MIYSTQYYFQTPPLNVIMIITQKPYRSQFQLIDPVIRIFCTSLFKIISPITLSLPHSNYNKYNSMRTEPSRLRKYLWESVHIRFSKIDLYDKKSLNSEELQKLLGELLDDASSFSTGNILRTVFKVDASTGKKELSLLDFTQVMLQYLGEVGLKTFNSLRRQTESYLSKDQFYTLFMSSFRCLNSMRVRKSFLELFFDSINPSKNPTLPVSEYERWIKQFISNPHLLQSQRKRYYLKEDDFAVPVTGDEPIIPEIKESKIENPERQPQQIRTAPKIPSEPIERNRPKFTRLDIAERILKHTITLLSKYDVNRNNNFQINEIESVLKDLLKSEEDQVYYGVVNDFRYNMEKVDIISYEAIAKFLLSGHFGEIIMKRMHKNGLFSKREQRKMNQAEFFSLFEQYLSIIQISIAKEDIAQIFSEIDRDGDQWIAYAEFLEFLKIFFRRKQTRISINIGTSTIMSFASEGAVGETIGHRRRAKVSNRVRKDVNSQWRNILDTNNLKSSNGLTELIRNQLFAIILRLDRERSFEQNKDALTRLLFEIFEKGSGEVEFAMRKVLKFRKGLDECLTYDELVRFLIEIQVGELTLEAFKSKKNLFGTNFKINFEDFASMIKQNCYYIGLDPSTEELEKLFAGIDKDSDGLISVNEFMRFIRIDLAGNVDIDNLLISVFDYALVKHQEKEQKKAKMKKELAKMIPLRRGQSKQVKEVVTQLYTDLKAIFDKYDVNNDEELDDKELEALLRGVLKMNTQHQLDYIFWNMFRIDKKGKGSVEFQDFAPFILKHSAEIALQRFHSQQKSGKSHLTFDEFKFLMNQAYYFISAIKKDNLHIIFGELDKDKDEMIEYKEFLGWILKDIAPKIR